MVIENRRSSMPALSLNAVSHARQYSTNLARKLVIPSKVRTDGQKVKVTRLSTKYIRGGVLQVKRTFCDVALVKPKQKQLKILVVGAKQVGKTALVVRYMTRRFIREYMSGEDQKYDRVATNLKHQPRVVFLDTSGNQEDEKPACSVIDDAKLEWADGIIVVYDVGDMSTLDHAKSVIDQVTTFNLLKAASSGTAKRGQRKKKTGSKLVLLLGNKADLWHRRRVGNYEAQLTAFKLRHLVECNELSAADDCDEVSRTFDDFLAKVHFAKQNRKMSF